VHGSYIGTDKFAHFLSWGYIYYTQYRISRGLGLSQEMSLQAAISSGKVNPVGESGLHGIATTGVFSNADLTANYIGTKFYINLTEPVSLKGEFCPPMLERRGELWELQPHAAAEGRYYSLFVSDHYDEALNPCIYEPVMRSSVRSFVRDHAGELLDWYAGDDPEKRRPEWFEEKRLSLANYYGEDYGYRGDASSLVLLSQLCFDSPPPPAEAPSTVKTKRRRLAPAERPPANSEARDQQPPAPIVVPYREPQLSVRSDAPEVNLLGAITDQTIVVANTGQAPATEFHVRLTIPQGLTVTTLESPADFDAARGTLTWKIAQLGPGEEQHLRFKARTVLLGKHAQRVEVLSGAAVLAQVVRPVEVMTQLASPDQGRGPVTVAVSDQDEGE
jgi:hypothetical protein